ncbi:head-tail connector protein, partial [Pseudomonas sp. zfem003]
MVDLARAKEHLRIEHDEEDNLIQAYLDAARAHVEAFCDRTIV